MKLKKLLMCILLLFGYGHMQAGSMNLSQLTTSAMTIIGLNISVNSSGNAMAVWGNSGDNSIYASFYNGSGWSAAQVIDGGSGGLSPWVSLNDVNKAVAVWQTSLTSGDVLSNTYVDGSGWQGVQTIISGVNFDNSTSASYPLSRMRVGVDPIGNAVAVWVEVDNSTTPTNWYVKTSVSIDSSGNSTGDANNWANTGVNILNSNNTALRVFFDPNSQVFLLINQTVIVSWVQNNNRAYIARYSSNTTTVSPSIVPYASGLFGSATSNSFDTNQTGNAFAVTIWGNDNVWLSLQPAGSFALTECNTGSAGNTVYNVWTALSNATDPLLHQAASFYQATTSPFSNPGYRIVVQSPVESSFQANCTLGLFPKNNVLDIDYDSINARLNPMIIPYSDNTATLFWNSQGTSNDIKLMTFDGQSWGTQGIQSITANLPAATSPSLDMPFYATNSRNVSNGQHYAGLIWWDSIAGHVFAIMSNGTSTPFGPSPALNLTAAATNCSSSPTITVGWQNSPDSDISAQYVYRNNGTGTTTYTPISGALSASATSYSDSSINTNIIYSYFVRTTNTAGLSSDSVIVTDECAGPKPASPILDATGRIQNGTPSIALSWNYRPNGNPLTGFQLWRTGGGGSETLIADQDVLPASRRGYTDLAIATGTNYTYYLYAMNGSFQSDPSNNATARVSAAPPRAPTGLTATCNPSATAVTLSWLPGSFGGTVSPYSQAIYRDGVYITSVSPTTSIYTDNTIVAGQPYTYSIYSVSGKNPEQSSNPDTILMPGCAIAMPEPPSGVTASDSSTDTASSITITWSASPTPGVTYNIYLGGTSTPIANVDPAQNGNQYVYVDTQVTFGNSYSYDVSATNANGESNLVPSNEVTPQQNAPSEFVANPSATCLNAGTAIELTWTPPANSCGRQEVYRTDLVDPLTTFNNCTNTSYSYTDNTTTTNIEYTYYIRAYNSTGSAYTDSKPITIECFASSPDAPIDLEGGCILDLENDTPALRIQWQVPSLADVISQNIYRNNSLIATTTANATSFIDTSIARGIRYAYNIATVNSLGATAKSDTLTVAACTIVAPELFNGTCGFNQFALEGEYFVTLNWKIPTQYSDNIAEQTIARDGIVIATLDSSQRQYFDHNRPAGATSIYTLSVTSQNGLIEVNGNTTVTC